MSEPAAFDLDWLALREPADREARDPALLAAAAAMAGDGRVIVDLGCGSGATWRALAPLTSADPPWRLVDNDAVALEAAARRITAPAVQCLRLDLRNLASLPLAGAGLVTASFPNPGSRGFAPGCATPARGFTQA